MESTSLSPRHPTATTTARRLPEGYATPTATADRRHLESTTDTLLLNLTSAHPAVVANLVGLSIAQISSLERRNVCTMFPAVEMVSQVLCLSKFRHALPSKNSSCAPFTARQQASLYIAGVLCPPAIYLFDRRHSTNFRSGSKAARTSKESSTTVSGAPPAQHLRTITLDCLGIKKACTSL